ncbi:Cellulose binding domain-containing protein [Micromonospora pattaloongensis]|uniref:Cellulose binding domain-containing protein n=1 Tax=Micromonospora pattaloongensis TaxID=405436 RepID=A0A1H3SU65_9ACTN|nr:cellulose binding domain-containing protein [Micromonospora pattaloongensis]SDZ41653.1 Cellulose binding domain-containing protein [Micromonospora pattaloongensis]
MTQRPRRTVPVALLDLTAVPLTALRDRLRAARRRLGDRALSGIAAGALAVLGGVATIVVVLLPGPRPVVPASAPPPADAAATPPAGSPGPHAGAASPVSLAAPGSSAPAPTDGRRTPRPESTPVVLTARYATLDSTLLSHRVSVVITNPGAAPAAGWTLVVTVPGRGRTVTQVSGAQARQSEQTWTFVPESGGPPLAPGRSVEVRFTVGGALLGAAPTECTVDGRPCEMTAD